MSNLAKDWQEGFYSVVVEGKTVAVSKNVKTGRNEHGFSTHKPVTATSRCAPEDEFSLSMGVALAMDRLNKQLEGANKKIKVGDKVKIKDYGLSYPTYTDWIKKNIDSVGLAACYAYGQIPEADNTVYVVKAIAPLGNENSPKLAYIQRYFKYYGKVSDDEVCYLMRIDGLEKVND